MSNENIVNTLEGRVNDVITRFSPANHAPSRMPSPTVDMVNMVSESCLIVLTSEG